MAQHNFLIENNPGRAVRTDFNGAIAALVANSSGAIEPPTPYPGMLWLDLSVLPDGLMRQRNQSNTGWSNMSGVPAKADVSDTVDGTDDSMYVTPAMLKARMDHQPAVVMNRLVNPAMQIAQEYTSASSSVAAVMYAADQWPANGVNGTQFTVAQFASVTPRKSPNRIRAVATAAKPALAAADTVNIYQSIEGIRIADLGFGTAKAKQVLARFGFRAPAGTYTFVLRQVGNRAYLHPFTISAANANKDTEQIIAIPGDVAGTWPVTNTISMQFIVNIACGATRANASIDTWLAGDWLGAAGGSNGIAVAGNTFELFDCGLYEDISGMGTPPRWQYPDITATLLDCQRYWCEAITFWSGSCGTGLTYYWVAALPVDMRALPTMVGVPLNNRGFAATVGALLATANAVGGAYRSVREGRASTASDGTGYFGSTVSVNARM